MVYLCKQQATSIATMSKLIKTDNEYNSHQVGDELKD